MNNIIFAIALGIIYSFCSCQGPAAGTPAVSQADQNLRNLHKLHRGIESGDLTVVDSIASVSFTDHLPGHTVVGRDSVKIYLRQVHDNIQDFKDSIIAESATDNWIFFMARITGTTKAPMMGKPTNTKLDFTAVRVIKVENGIFVETRAFLDPGDVN